MLGLAFAGISCKENKKKSISTPIDAGRAYIEATRTGDFKVAERLLLKDNKNTIIFNSQKDLYENLPATKKVELSKSAYVINNIDDINDSVIIINYSNGYEDKPLNIKVVRNKQEWLIDLK